MRMRRPFTKTASRHHLLRSTFLMTRVPSLSKRRRVNCKLMRLWEADSTTSFRYATADWSGCYVKPSTLQQFTQQRSLCFCFSSWRLSIPTFSTVCFSSCSWLFKWATTRRWFSYGSLPWCLSRFSCFANTPSKFLPQTTTYWRWDTEKKTIWCV